MPKINPLVLKRREQPAATRAFTDPDQPEAEVTLTCRAIAGDPATMIAAEESAAELAERYSRNYFPMPNGAPVKITRKIAETVCYLATMQCGPEEETYSAEELIGVMVNMPTAFAEMLTWSADLNQRAQARRAPGNPSRAA